MSTSDPGDGPDVDDVVTCFLRHRGEVLLVRRSGRVGSYRGRWGAVSGFAEGDPLEGAWREISEETGLEGAVTLVKQGEPFGFEDAEAGHRWRVHPFLFDAATRDARLDWEAEEGAWVSPVEILTRDTVPRLWTSYQRVGPTEADIRADHEHGSAWLSLRAVEALRDGAATAAAEAAAEAGAEAGAARPALAGLARSLGRARPAMTALRNRVDRVMARALGAAGPAAGAAGSAAAVRDAAEAVLREAMAAEEGAAAEVARAAAGRKVLTLSLSSTLLEGLLAAAPAPARVVVCESRPGGEGRTLAARLAEAGLEVVLVPDAAVAWALGALGVELVLVGADTVLADGAVVNKVGTHPAALAARAAGVRALAAASSDKIAAAGEAADAAEEAPGEDAAEAVPPGGRQAGVARRLPRRRAPLFERVPAALFDGVLTERGVLTRRQVRAIAAEHAADRGWDPERT